MTPVKILFFIAGAVPTAPEVAAIARMTLTGVREVYVRNAAENATYNSNLEAHDFVADVGDGSLIPEAFDESDVYEGPKVALAPDQLKVFPAAVSLDASNADVQQLAVVSVSIDADTGLATLTDVAADAATSYVSSDPTKATVGATGLVTAVAAGSTTITAMRRLVAAITGIAAEADDDIFTKVAHGLLTGEGVDLLALGGGTGFGAINDRRYIIKLTDDTFKLATSFENALAGTAIDVTGDAVAASLVKARVTSTSVITVVA
jgi:hypothetical protein